MQKYLFETFSYFPSVSAVLSVCANFFLKTLFFSRWILCEMVSTIELEKSNLALFSWIFVKKTLCNSIVTSTESLSNRCENGKPFSWKVYEITHRNHPFVKTKERADRKSLDKKKYVSSCIGCSGDKVWIISPWIIFMRFKWVSFRNNLKSFSKWLQLQLYL